MVRKYRKKPIVIEAMLYDRKDNDIYAIWDWAGDEGDRFSVGQDGKVEIETLEGVVTADIGDYIIRGVEGEFYPCKPSIFAATYEEV